MDDKVNTSQNTEYAGPPKSHAFQNNTLAPQPAQNTASNELANVGRATNTTDQKDNELLDMISAGDQVKRENKKKKLQISFDVKELVAYKRKIHEYVKSKTALFQKLNLVWMILKFFFYAIGLGFFIACFVLYLKFETLVGLYLKEHQLEDVSIQKIDYSLTGVTFTNVREKSGLFQIKKIKASFSFASLINKKIQQIELNGLQIFPGGDQTLSDSFESLTMVLSKLGVLNNRSLFSVQTLRLENSQMHITNPDHQLTVNFSGVGNLTDQKQIQLPINIETPYLSMTANMQISFGSVSTSWTIEIASGSITLPILEKQSLSGKLTALTQKGNIQNVSFSGVLTKDGLDKSVDLQLSQQDLNKYLLTIAAQVQTKDPVRIDFSVSDIVFDKNLTSFSSEGTVATKISNFKSEKFNVEAFQLVLPSVLSCNRTGCSAQLIREGEVVFFTPQYKLNETTWSVLFPMNLYIEPSDESFFSIDDIAARLKVSFSRTNFEARKTRVLGEQATAKIILRNVSLHAQYDIPEKQLQGVLKTSIQRFVDDLVDINRAELETFFTAEKHKSHLMAQQITLLQFPYFKLPVQVDANFDSNYAFIANIGTSDKWLSVSADGYYSPYTGEVFMNIKNNRPLILTDKTPQLEQYSALFSPDMHHITGRVDFKGQIHYNNTRSINGPLQVLLDDVSFDYGNMKVTGLNSVLDITHLLPFGTQGSQEIFIQSVQALIPFENVYTKVILDANRKQFNISALDATVAGYPLRLDPMWYGYNAPSYTFSLKGKSVPLQNIVDNLTLKNLTLNGNGSFSLIAQLQGSQFLLRRLELSVPSEGMLRYNPPSQSNPNLKDLDPLDFRRLSAYLIQQSNSFELQLLADNKAGKARKKANFYFTITDPLLQYVKSLEKQPVPESIVRAKQEF